MFSLEEGQNINRINFNENNYNNNDKNEFKREK